MMLLCDAHLHLAPLDNPRRILDIGTGTGIWAIQMADDYPDCTVIGTDLSPVQPSWYGTLVLVSWTASNSPSIADLHQGT